MEFNHDKIDLAFRNSYALLVNGEKATDIITSEEGYFIHHPAKPITPQHIEDMLEYFSSRDEFEKCIKLKELLGR